jgi:hypothetical protein
MNGNFVAKFSNLNKNSNWSQISAFLDFLSLNLDLFWAQIINILQDRK